MSFENKGFPNDLNKRFEALNNQYQNYTPLEEANKINAPLPASTLPIGPQLPTIKTYSNTQGALTGYVAGGGLSTADNPAELPQLIVKSNKKKKNSLKIIGISLIVILLIIYASKLIKK